MTTPGALQSSEPAADDDFAWVDKPWGRALEAGALARVADHFFTTRQLRLRGTHEQESTDWALVARAIGVAPPDLVRTRQVHGMRVLVAHVASGAIAPDASEADILLTNDSSHALSVRVADCVPLLVADPVTGAVAAAHAGWRGTAAGVASRTVEALARTYGARPADLLVAIGPSIGPCCYEVGHDVLDAFEHARVGASRWFAPQANGGFHLDLWRATCDQLEAAGVAPTHISVARLCTATHREWFFSFRCEGSGTGRLVGVIRSARRER